ADVQRCLRSGLRRGRGATGQERGTEQHRDAALHDRNPPRAKEPVRSGGHTESGRSRGQPGMGQLQLCPRMLFSSDPSWVRSRSTPVMPCGKSSTLRPENPPEPAGSYHRTTSHAVSSFTFDPLLLPMCWPLPWAVDAVWYTYG